MRRRGRGFGPAFLVEEFVPTFPRHAALMLGFVQMLLGLASFVGAILAEVYYAYNYIIYDGFWCGSFFFTSASAALHAGRLPTRRRIKGAIFCAVISFAFVGTEFGLSVDGLVVNVDYPTSYPYGYVNVDYDFPGMEAANGLMLSACGVELILLIVQIYISARALKEYKPQAVNSGAQVVVPPYGHVHPGAQVVMPQYGQVHPGAQVVMPPYGQAQPTVTFVGPQQPPLQVPPQQWYTNTAFAAPPAYDNLAPPTYVK